MKIKLHDKVNVFYILTFFMFLFGGVINGYAVNRYAVRSGNWNETTTWSAFSGGNSGASVPIAGDVVYIERGFTVTVTATASCSSLNFITTTTPALGALVINSGSTLNVTNAITVNNSVSSSVTASFSGLGTVTCGALNIGNGDTISSNGIYTHTLTSSITNLTIKGNLTINSYRGNNDQRISNGVFNHAVGSLTVNGSIATSNNNSSTVVVSSYILGNSSSLILAGAVPFLISSPVNSTIKLDGKGSTVNYNAGGDQDIMETTYDNLVLSGSGDKTISGVVVSKNLSVSGSASVITDSKLDVSGTTTLSGSGSLTLEDSYILSPNPIVLDGGTLSTGSGTGFDETVGKLGLINNSTIALGSDNHSLKFAASNDQNWTGESLTITGWNGAAEGRLFVGSTSSGLTAAQLSKIVFEGYDPGAIILSTGEILPAWPFLTISRTSLPFEFVASGVTSVNQTYSLTGSALSGFPSNIEVAAPANFEVSLFAGSGFGASVNVPYTTASLAATTIYVRFKPTASNVNYNGDITNSGGGAVIKNVMVSGNSFPSYCSSSGNTSSKNSITSVVFNTINKISARPSGYSDYTTSSTDVILGASYSLAVKQNTNGKNTAYARAWIDWNANGTFEDNEGYDLGTTYNSKNKQSSISPKIAVPVGAVIGAVRMRIASKLSTYPTSCEMNFDGEVEDYSINIVPGSIATGTISGSAFCAGSAVSVPYTVSGIFNSGNVFSAQLSDANGNFTSAVTIGTLSSTASGTISAVIPFNTAAGTKYRIRVISSNAGVIGTVNGSNLTIKIVSAAPTTTGVLICIGSPASLTLSASGAITGYKYKWYDVASGGTALKTSSNNTDNTYGIGNPVATKNYWVSILNSNGCESDRTQVTATYPASSPDSQTTEGTDSWIGHVYKGTNAGVLYTGSFTNYFGFQAEPEQFDESFGGDINCLPITSSLGSRSIYTETFSVRYRMKSTKKGLYVVDLGSDDGGRLAVDGALVYNNWSDQSFSAKPRVLISLTGSSSLQYDYYENSGGNRVIFNNLTRVLSNTLATNTSQNVCLGNSAAAISGDTYGALPAGISLSGTGYQWASSQSPNGPWVNISGATGATYTPSLVTAPFNSAGTYYIIRKAILSSSNNVSPNPNVLTNESNAATIVINDKPAIPGAITGTTTQCPGVTNQVYSIDAVANATIYNWTVPAGWSITNGQGTNEIKVTVGAAGQNGNISVSAGNGCSVSQNKTLAVTVGSCINKWKGSISNNWNTPANWTQNFVPAVDASIVFDDAPVNHLVLDQNRSVTNITNAQSIYRVVCNGFKLTQKGNTLFTNGAQIDASTAGSVMEFAGAAAQSIPAGSFVNDAVFNLTVNNVNNVTVNGNLRILNLLNVSSGRLDAFSNSPTIIYGGSSAQTIESNQYLNEKIFNLNIDNTNGVTLNTNFALANNLTINSAKKFIIDAAKSLTVAGFVTNNAGTTGLILKSTAAGTASLIHNTNNVPATVQRYISGAKEAWHFLSSPVSNQTIVGSSLTPSGTYGNGTGYDLYIWNEPTPCWIYHKNDEGGLTIDPKNPKWPAVHSSTNFIPGCGYLYSVQATNPTTEFTGNLNNGSIIYSITNSINGEDPKVRGFNLVGNPYPSTIDWKAASGWTRDDLVVSGGGYDMWIWNPATNNYGVFNSGTAIGTNGVTQNIAPMQGFFVRAATNGNIGMTNNVRGTTGTSSWMRMKTTTAEIVKVQIASNDNYGSDEILLQFGAPANEAGAPKLFSTVTTAPSLFLNREKKELSVLNLTNVIENSSVSLMFKAGKDGNYALSIGNESASYEVLLLEDKKTKTITDLNLIPTYQFKGSVKDAADRFILHFVPITPEEANLPAVIYYDGREINVDLTLVAGQTDVKIYNMSGKLLVDKKVEGKMIHSFNINPQYEIYIVVVNSKGHSTRRKVLTY